MALTTLTVDQGSNPTAPVAVDSCGAGGYAQVMKLGVSAAGVITLIPADTNGLWIQGAGTMGAPAGGVVSTQDPDVTASAALTAVAQSATLSGLNGASTVAVYASGAPVGGTFVFEGSVDGANWTSLYAAAVPGGALVANTSGAGCWQIDSSGFSGVRVRCSAITSGTLTVALRGSSATGAIALDAPLPAGTNLIGGVNVSQYSGQTPAMASGADGATVPRFTLSTRHEAAATPLAIRISADGTNFTSTSYAIAVQNIPQAGASSATSPFFPTSGNIVAAFIKASAGNLYALFATNQVAAVTWLCFYNKTTAPVLGTDTPAFALPIPAGAGTGILTIPPGAIALASFATGIAWAAATTPAGAAAPATAPTGMCFYK
jgi:hypothetical protein